MNDGVALTQVSRQETSGVHGENGVAQLLLNILSHHIVSLILDFVGACHRWHDAADAVEVIRVHPQILAHVGQNLNHLKSCGSLRRVLVLGQVIDLHFGWVEPRVDADTQRLERIKVAESGVHKSLQHVELFIWLSDDRIGLLCRLILDGLDLVN